MSIRKKFSGLGILNSQFVSYKEKQEDYYSGQNDIKSYSNFFSGINGKSDDIGYYEASDIIKPFNVEFNSNQKQVIQALGKPSFILKDTGLDNHRVLFYKRKTLEYRYLLQVHFINDKMVYAMNRLYDLSTGKDDNFFQIFQILLKKYIDTTVDIKSFSSFVITDKFDNAISIKESIVLNIRYTSGDEEFKKFIENEMQEEKSKKKNDYEDQINSLLNYL